MIKETRKELTANDCICQMVAYNGALQVAHWMANTVTNEHKALGDLYDSMVGLIDTFTETYIGKYGMITFKPMKLENVSKTPCAKGLVLAEDLKSYLSEDDDDLLNIVADMFTALHKAKYMLKE